MAGIDVSNLSEELDIVPEFGGGHQEIRGLPKPSDVLKELKKSMQISVNESQHSGNTNHTHAEIEQSFLQSNRLAPWK